MHKQFSILAGLILALFALGACRTEPAAITVVETVEVEKVVEKEVTVVETVEVEKVVEVEVPAAAASEAEQEYVLGIVLPFTGPLGSFGVGFRNGIHMEFIRSFRFFF